MLRTFATVSGRTLVRGLRSRRPAKALSSRAARLRLESLENREQPGTVMTGLEPLQIMASVTGVNALTKEPAGTGGAAATPQAAQAQLPFLASGVAAYRAAKVAEQREAVSAKGLDLFHPLAVAGEPADLSIADTKPAALPADAGAQGGGGGSNGAGPTQIAPPPSDSGANSGLPTGTANQPDSIAPPAPDAGSSSVPMSTTFTVHSAGVAAPAAVRNVVTVKAVSPNSTAGGGVGGFLIYRTGTTGDLTIHYKIGGTAKPGTDYTALSGTVTITAGNLVAAVPLDPQKFDAATGKKTVSLRVTAGTGYTVGTARAGTAQVGNFKGQPVVTVVATVPDASALGATQPGAITFTRTETAGNLRVDYTVLGTATPGGNYLALPGSVVIPAGQTSATIPIRPLADAAVKGPTTVDVGLLPSTRYMVGAKLLAEVTIAGEDGQAGPLVLGEGGGAPPPRTAHILLSLLAYWRDCGCDPAGLLALMAEAGLVDPPVSNNPVRYGIGDLFLTGADLSSDGFGEDWGVTRTWSNQAGYDGFSGLGNGWATNETAHVVLDGLGNAFVVLSANSSIFFTLSGSTYTNYFGGREALTHDTTNKLYILTDDTGKQFQFYDEDSSYPSLQQGSLKEVIDPDGSITQVTSHDSSGRITETQRSRTIGGTTTVESYLTNYITSGANAGLASDITLRRQVGGGSWTTVRKAVYSYYDGTTANGNLGDLERAIVQDSSGSTISEDYYRYYTSNTSPGYTGGLKYFVGGEQYARMESDLGGAASVDAASDATIAPYLSNYFEYVSGSDHRVAKEIAAGAGCSACSGGQGTYTFAYTDSVNPAGMNSWATKTVETLPDGNTNTVYTNAYGAMMLKAYTDTTTSQTWTTFWQYDSTGRPIMQAAPSAVIGYSDSYADLMNFSLGVSPYIQDSSGLIEKMSYGASTTATSSTPGDVQTYLKEVDLKRGETGTAVPQENFTYTANTNSSSITIYPIATDTVYRNSDGTGSETTTHAYTFYTGTNQEQQETITRPAATTGENGSGSADADIVVYDTDGRPVWTKDAGGFINYTEYDPITGAVTKTIQDVDTTQTGTFVNLPSGWTTPTGGGLQLTTTYVVDSLGRVTKETSPNLNVTYTVYNDSTHEVRVYPGWDATNNVPTGPTQVYRQDWTHGYAESLTMSATPTVSGGVPTGAESIASVQTLSRKVLNKAGQVVDGDQYITLAGTSYSQSSVTLGTSGTNYNRTQIGYDEDGRENRVQTPTGTIYRTVTDGQGRVVSTWVGTNDTPGSGEWSPTNNTSPSNMVDTTDYQYDGGGVGDSDLTQITQHPGGGAADRVTAMASDWRDRLIATKQGVETSESTSLNRPITYVVLDNLGEVTETDQYDGDGLSITTDANNDGVPDAPSSGALRARTTDAFDEQQRLYQEKTFSVDPSTGSVSTNALTTNLWYNSRGLQIKQSAPGGLVTKDAYDGAGRVTTEYLTDGGGDTGYSDAGNVTGDNVLQQTEQTFDADGNPTLTATRQRFHDQTGTGALGTPTTGVLSRVYYQAGYFDAADRPTANVDVGTNGGTAYTRPGTVPGRSDTVLVTSNLYNAAGWSETVTDPMALLGKTYYDMAGQTLKTIQDYTTGTPTNSSDKTAEFTYNGNNQNVNVSADLVGGGQETTANVFGVGSSGNLYSNDLVAAVEYPDPTTGSPSSSSEDTYSYNQLGQVLTNTDRNGNVHTYSYDVVGRLTADAVTTLGTGVDGTVRRIEYAYDGQGNTYLITSYDSVSGGSVVNQVQRAYNGLGQLTQEWQATSGSVNTSTSPSVQYAYSFAPSGSTNHSRLTSITYPNGRVITYNYASGLSDTISRLSSISDGATTLESDSYLGLDTVVKRTQGSGVSLDYTTPLPGTAGANDGSSASSSGAGVAWTNPRNALSADGSFATAALSQNGVGTSTSQLLTVTGFGFSIPSTATVVGIGVSVKRKASVSSGAAHDRDSTVKLVSGGGAVGTNEADTSTNWPTTNTSHSYGGSADAWSAGLSAANVNSSGFGVELAAVEGGTASNGSATASVDDIQVTVYYTVPTGDAGDKYTGLDRFGRVVDQAWVNGSGVAVDRFQYGYDRDSNRLYANNLVNSARSELYAYDGLNQLTSFQRGTLNSTNTGLTGSASRSQSWVTDAVGNFTSQVSDGTTQTRSENKQNEITSVSGATTPTYDSAGDMTGDETGKQFVYDAWGRLAVVKNSGGTTLATYRYDGLDRRVRDIEASTTDLYYSSAWQVLEEDVAGSPVDSYVWSPVYVDALIARDRSTGGGTLNERLYAVQDANWNVTALLSTTGVVNERYAYDSYGTQSVMDGSWGSRSSSSYAEVYGFQGLRYDAVSGTYNTAYRQESPTLDVWARNDPLGFGGGDVNLYRYESNQSTNTVDPLGLDTDRQIWICATGSGAGGAAATWHALSAVYDSAVPWGATQHTIPLNSKRWSLKKAVEDMTGRKLIGDCDTKITFLELACHGSEFRNLIPHEFLGEDIDIFNRQFSALIGKHGVIGATTMTMAWMAENRAKIEELRDAIRAISKHLAPDAEIRINSCKQGARKMMMRDMARQFGAKVCANDGDFVGTGTGQWWITDSIGSNVYEDTRGGAVPEIGRSINSIRGK